MTKRVYQSPNKGKSTIGLEELLVNGEDAAFRELIALMYSSVGRLQAMRRELAQALDVSSAELAVLMGLRHLIIAGAVRITSIAGHLHTSASNVTATIIGLQEKGWLKKLPDASDQRAVRIEFTEAGTERLETFTRACTELNDIWFKDVTRPEMFAVTAFLRHLDKRFPAAFYLAKSLNRRKQAA